MHDQKKDSQEKPIRTLGALPGGNDQYLTTLISMLDAINQEQAPSRQWFESWVSAAFGIRESNANKCVQTIVRLDVIEIDARDICHLTPFGERVLRARKGQQAWLLARFLFERCTAIPEILHIIAAVQGPIHVAEIIEKLTGQFPQWSTASQFEHRICWLYSLDCLALTAPRTYVITQRGLDLLGQPISDNTDNAIEVAPVPTPSEKIAVEILAGELEEAARDSQSYQRLEQAIQGAFAYLGFDAEWLGSPGDTDILVTAYAGPQTYSAILDAKSRQNGRLYDLNVLALQAHRRSNHADYAAVLAESFSDGRLVEQAEAYDIVLLGIPVLVELLQVHATTPLNLIVYQSLFTKPGLIAEIPAEIIDALKERQKMTSLIGDMVDLVQETYRAGLTLPLPAGQLFSMLITRQREVRYSAEEVRAAAEFLTHPILRAGMNQGNEGMALGMTRHTLAETLRMIAQSIEAT